MTEEIVESVVVPPKPIAGDVSVRKVPLEVEVSGKKRIIEASATVVPRPVSVDVSRLVRHKPTAVEITPPVITIQGGGGVGMMVIGEIPSGSIDGVNVYFNTSYAFPGNQLWVYLNGLRQHTTNDYIILSNNSFQMVTAPLAGDFISVDYVVTP